MTAVKVYSPQDRQIQVHKTCVTPCPPELPAGFYWYSYQQSGPGRPQKWVERLLAGTAGPTAGVQSAEECATPSCEPGATAEELPDEDLPEGEQRPSNTPYNEDIPEDAEDCTGILETDETMLVIHTQTLMAALTPSLNCTLMSPQAATLTTACTQVKPPTRLMTINSGLSCLQEEGDVMQIKCIL